MVFAQDPHADLLAECESVIGYQFKDLSLLTAALTHASGAQHRLASNERLEFLGDSILGVIVCERLFRHYPQYLEGDLTRIKSVVVSRQTCAKISGELGLERFLILGKGMSVHRTVPSSLLADVFESLVAAIYLDGGMKGARRFVETHIDPQIEEVASGESGDNYKSELQHYAQRELGCTPTYVMVDQKGPDHNKSFKIAAQVGQDTFAPAWGRSKKEAEQKAAKKAIEQFSDTSTDDADAEPADVD